MTVARAAGHIPSVENGEDAIYYQIVPSTLVVSLDANGNWVSGTPLYRENYAKVTFKAYKITGNNRELFSDCYWLGGDGSPIRQSEYQKYVSKNSTSVNITLCKLAWTDNGTPIPGDVLDRVTIVVNKEGKNGNNGKSVQCQYSADGKSWHSPFILGDIWMRSRIEGEIWGNAMRIVGEKGTNGEYTKYSFGISSQETTSGIGVSPSDISSWSDAPITTTENLPFLWMQVVRYDSNGNAGTPSYIRINGKDGTNGTSISIKGSFSSTASLPSKATLGDSYIINGDLWVFTDEKTAGSVNGFINAGRIKGDPGTSATQYYYHIAWCNDIKTFTGFTTSNPSGATYSYMGICYTNEVNDPNDKNLYKWSKIEGKPAVTYELALDTKSVTANGETGEFLTNNLGNFRFIRHTGDITEELSWIINSSNYLILIIGYNGTVIEYSTDKGEDDIYAALSINGVNDSEVAMMKFFWYSGSIYTDSEDYIDQLKKLGGVPSPDMPFTILASNTFTVVKQGTNGKRGSSGAIWRQHRGFVESSYSYMAGGNDEQFLDVVLYQKKWYRCITSYQSAGISDEKNLPQSSSFSKYWKLADMSGFSFIATDFFLAENAQINLFGAQEINLLKDSETGEVFGSYRVPNGNGDDKKYALWLGASTGAYAPFSVTKDGAIKSTRGTIGGFDINESSIGSKSLLSGTSGIDGMLLTDDMIIFNKEHRQAIVGAFDFTGVNLLGNFDDTYIDGGSALTSKYGLRVAVSGSMDKNIAIALSRGNVASLAVDTYTYMGSDVTSPVVPTAPVNIALDRSVGAAAISTGFRYRENSTLAFEPKSRDVNVTLPEMHKYDDGHIIHIKRLVNNGNYVYLHPAGCWRLNADGTETFADTIILYDNSSYSTNLRVVSEGDAMTLVFFYDLIVTVGNNVYKGVWVQYKHPREW